MLSHFEIMFNHWLDCGHFLFHFRIPGMFHVELVPFKIGHLRAYHFVGLRNCFKWKIHEEHLYKKEIRANAFPFWNHV